MRLYLLVAIIFGLMAWVGTMSYTDALAEDSHYRLMVCADVWPDFRNIEPTCPEIKDRHY